MITETASGDTRSTVVDAPCSVDSSHAESCDRFCFAAKVAQTVFGIGTEKGRANMSSLRRSSTGSFILSLVIATGCSSKTDGAEPSPNGGSSGLGGQGATAGGGAGGGAAAGGNGGAGGSFG